jgi:hypothetical protein
MISGASTRRLMTASAPGLSARTAGKFPPRGSRMRTDRSRNSASRRVVPVTSKARAHRP